MIVAQQLKQPDFKLILKKQSAKSGSMDSYVFLIEGLSLDLS